MSFKFGLNQLVEIAVSGEFGAVKARAEHANGAENGYYVHYKAGDGRAVTQWFDESDLSMVEADEAPGQPVYGITELPKDAVAQ
ncbi:hypothetical protein MUU49_19390 [Scandinavium goeteborgense]|uniref:hypothetical protein n=1 Tax=Scandinavium goeteborgense TaxID=1851514 RepID=UPI00216510AB|nr:hypothetical protein [Scandinavium goeteborgense]MCS2154722.1 hypothetical protein [Scandinavium goeteborgense]